jgi:hypothetical protein
MTTFACGSPSAPAAPVVDTSAPAPSQAPPSQAPTEKAAGPAPTALAAEGGACASKCTGRVGQALVEALQKRAIQSHRCYDAALAKDKTVRGRVKVHAKIAADGHFCEVTADSDDKAMAQVASCVAASYRDSAIAAASLPPPDDGCAVVDAPINFVPRADTAPAP